MNVFKYQIVGFAALTAISMYLGAYLGWFAVGFYCAQTLHTLANRQAVLFIADAVIGIMGVMKNDLLLVAVVLTILGVGVAGSYQVFTIWQFVAYYATMALFTAGIYVIYRQVKTIEKLKAEVKFNWKLDGKDWEIK